ncbi:MAG: ATP-binding protein [Myxococcales bacterium]|nr:ATP-binding protein [Myxococcales bacterium]
MAKPKLRKLKSAKSSKQAPHLAVGKVERSFEVGLSYRLVELFSEGLYTSANKAFEELVSNSFDAGARHVQVLLPADASVGGATIAVIDDGEGMNAKGLEQLWQIGASQKRTLTSTPLNRTQIGKFGIGKLATYDGCADLHQARTTGTSRIVRTGRKGRARGVARVVGATGLEG